jgi:hypothetical protein
MPLRQINNYERLGENRTLCIMPSSIKAIEKEKSRSSGTSVHTR